MIFAYDTIVTHKPLSHQTAMPQCLYSVLKTCQRAVGRRKLRLKISNLPEIAFTQRPRSVPTASTQRLHSVFKASMRLLYAQEVAAACSRRAAGKLTAPSPPTHSAHTEFSR